MMSIKRLLLILFVAIIICPQLAVADREAIIKARQEAEKAFVKWTIGPYLQNPSPTSMTICFLSDHAQEVSAVVENASGGDGTSHSAVGVLIPRTAVTVWKVRLTGLSSGTEYQYNIEYKVDGKQVVEKQHNFTTPSLAALTTHCIVLNDVHDQTWIVEELMKHVAPDDYEFSILLGDCWGDPNWGINGYFVTNRLSEFIRILNGAEKPILYVRGNHECRGNFSGRMGYLFDLPNLNPAAPYYEQDYHFSFAAGPLYFLFNDCGEDGNKRAEQFRPYRLRQAKWLASEIKKPAYRSAKYHIFASHIPLYNVNNWFADYCRSIWAPVLADADIDLAIAGHDHQWRVLDKGRVCANENSLPYPLRIGGGPSLGGVTVMLLKADQKTLSLCMLNAAGNTLSHSQFK